MDIYARVKRDNRKILNREAVVLTIFNSIRSDEEGYLYQTVQGKFFDVALDFDANGQPFIGRGVGISFHLADVTIAETGETFENWRVSFVNNIGETVTGRMKNPMIDRTVGMVVSRIYVDGEVETE